LITKFKPKALIVRLHGSGGSGERLAGRQRDPKMAIGWAPVGAATACAAGAPIKAATPHAANNVFFMLSPDRPGSRRNF
jgi:hypothetical protein